MRRADKHVAPMAAMLLVIVVSAAACSSVQPQPFSAFASSVQHLREGADASLASVAAQAHERFVKDAAGGDQAKIQALLLEQIEGDPFGWKTDAPILFLQVARFRDGVSRLNSALNEYAQLLVQLASPDLIDAKTFDQLATDLNANLRNATATLGLTGADNKDIAIFSTLATAAAHAFIEHRRQSALVRIVEANQAAIADVSAAGRSAVRRTAIAARNEYDLKSGGLASAIAGDGAGNQPSASEKAGKIQDLIDLNDGFILQLGVLRTLNQSYATLPRAHAQLAEGLRHPKMSLDMVRQLYEEGQRLYRLSEELTKAESKPKSTGATP